jgi:hypothetical protein
MSGMGHLRPMDLPSELAACPLAPESGQLDGRLGKVRFVPILLQKSVASFFGR